MYSSIDTDKLDFILDEGRNPNLSNEERLRLFRRASNTLKLKNVSMKNLIESCIVYQDDYYSYVNIANHKPASTSNVFFLKDNNPVKTRTIKEFSEYYSTLNFILAIPNSILTHLKTNKTPHDVEQIYRKSSQNGMAGTYRDPRNMVACFFESLLHHGIESDIYIYCMERNWFSPILEYTHTKKQCLHYGTVKNIKHASDGVNYKNYDSMMRVMKENMYGNDISNEDAALLFLTQYGTRLGELLEDIMSRKLLVHGSDYDIFKTIREEFVKCME